MSVIVALRRCGRLDPTRWAGLVTLITLASTAGARADAPAVPPTVPIVAAPDSPRASLSQYLDLSRARQWQAAGRYLALPPERLAEAPVLAERLKAVLDRHAWFDMDRISPLSEGDRNDGLPVGTEAIARVPGRDGRLESVFMTRTEGTDGAFWQFAPATVMRIDGWYDRLGDRWIRDHIPASLLRPGPRELLWWQWMALPLLFFVSWLLGQCLTWITRRILGALFRRTQTQWDDVMLERLGGPLVLLWGVAVAFLLLPWLALYAPAQDFIHRIFRAGVFVAFFWSLLRTVDVGAQVIAGSAWGLSRKAVSAFLPLGVRIAKVVVLAMAVIAILSELGYPVASLIAGLGIGGLALALAAQKTVENLFGSVSLGVDQPIRVGDFVKVDDFVGTVEAIGLRSTRIRTPDRTVISIPNGKLADMRLETFAARDRIRFQITIGLVYGTTEAQMRTVVTEFERILRSHPKVWPDAIRVVFAQFADFSLNVECMCWFATTDGNEFNYIRQDVLLQFMKVVEAAGTSFAYPRTVHLVQDRG